MESHHESGRYVTEKRHQLGPVGSDKIRDYEYFITKKCHNVNYPKEKDLVDNKKLGILIRQNNQI